MANSDEELTDAIRKGVVTVSSLIQSLKNDYNTGKLDKDSYESFTKHVLLIDKMLNAEKNGELMNLQDLVDFGICDNLEEVYNILEEHKDEINENHIRYNCVLSPEPSKEEINQIYDSEDPDKVCIICVRRKRHVVFIPCGHSALCTVCAKTYNESKKDSSVVECIICKSAIESMRRVFIA